MGRPLRKDVNGVDVIGNNVGGAGIVVSARLPGFGSAKSGYIIRQLGARAYQVTNADGTDKCKLVESITDAGQMVINGYNSSGEDATATPIRKLQKRTAIDFSGNRYKWYLTNYQDSSGDQIILVPIV